MQPKDPWIGKMLGESKRYRLESLIGEGGMGRVYKAIDRKLSVDVAIKLMISSGSTYTQNKERFKREMQACVNLQNSRVVRAMDCGVAVGNFGEPIPFIVMEYISSPTLSDVMEKQPRFTISRAVNLAIQIGAALQTLHTGITLNGKPTQIVHRDLKPSNIFVLDDGLGSETIKLADFGLVKLQGETGLSQTGKFLGTLQYASPIWL